MMSDYPLGDIVGLCTALVGTGLNHCGKPASNKPNARSGIGSWLQGRRERIKKEVQEVVFISLGPRAHNYTEKKYPRQAQVDTFTNIIPHIPRYDQSNEPFLPSRSSPSTEDRI